jgi:alkanesulfonate monooxygenase SsuD/methylene tetrahydromethanopterin reductase-like flavin-dependent oxidoreductase (luciferase family)
VERHDRPVAGKPYLGAMNNSTQIRRGLGITAGIDAGLARDLAARCEHLGYHSLWSNDEPGSPGLETLAHFADGAPHLVLGVGVLPLDRHQPIRIAAEIDRLRLDPERLWIGIGSGQLHAPIEIVQRAVAKLREYLPEQTRIVVAAMRPRLCRVGGAIADGVLLNWMLPAQAAQARRWVQEGAAEAGCAAPVVASYVRVAVGSGAEQRLRDEEGYYRNINAGHRKHFEAMDAQLGSVGVAASTRPEVLEGLAPYHAALDLPIARVLAEGEATTLAAAVAAAPEASCGPTWVPMTSAGGLMISQSRRGHLPCCVLARSPACSLRSPRRGGSRKPPRPAVCRSK